MTHLLVLLTVLLTASLAESQVVCFGYGGGMVSCDGPSGNTLIAPLAGGAGMIYTDRDAVPYRTIPPTTSTPFIPFASPPQGQALIDRFESPRRMDDSPSMLRRLDTLETLELPDPFNDPLLRMLE